MLAYSGFMFVAGITVASFAIGSFQVANGTVLLAIGLLVIGVAPFVIGHCRRYQADWLEPVNVYAVVFTLYYAGRALYLNLEPSDPIVFPSLGAAFLYQAHLPLVLAFVGLLSFYLGYYCIALRTANTAIDVSAPSSAMLPTRLSVAPIVYGLLLCLAGMAGLLLSLRSGQFVFFARDEINPAYVYPLRLLNEMRLFGIIVLWSEQHRFKSAQLTALVALAIAIDAVLIALGGSKEDLLRLVFALLVVTQYRRPGALSVRALATCAGALVLAFGMFGGYREQYHLRYGSIPPNAEMGLHQSSQLAIDATVELLRSPVHFVVGALETVANRFAGLDSLVAGVLFTPGDGFLMGQTIWPALLSPVPRIIWADKPSSDFNLWFQVTYAGVPWDNPSRTAIMTLTDLYVNFGPLGTTLGMLCLGCACGLLYRTFIRSSGTTSTRDLLLYLAILLPIIRIESSVGGIISELLILIPLAYALGFPLRSPSPYRKSARRGPSPISWAHRSM